MDMPQRRADENQYFVAREAVLLATNGQSEGRFKVDNRTIDR
jgi:hypothetical protein